MEIFKVAGIGVLAVILSGVLKKDNPEFVPIVTIAGGAIVLVMIISSMSGAIAAFDALVEKTGVDQKLFGGVLKIIGIGYVTEYASAICEDQGSRSTANKIQLAGKISIFLMALPIVNALVDSITRLI